MSVAKRAIRLVTFDLDNTLWGMDGVIRRAEAKMDEWLAERAANFRRPRTSELRAIHDAVLAAHPGIEHDISRRRELMVRAMLERSGCSPGVAAELAAGAFAVFLDWRHRVELFPETLDVLQRLGRDYVLAALTNGNADYRRVGLARHFAFGYSAGEVGAQKPAPTMFRRALARANVQPAQAVHVGDHPVDDIEGARNVGMATIWVRLAEQQTASFPAGWLAGARPSPAKTGSCAPTATVTTLGDVPAAVAALG